MPLHDFRCDSCGTVLADQYRTIAQGASEHPPTCPDCGDPMAWVPQIGMMDAFEPNFEFDTYDGQNKPVKVESFRQMHKLEQESEQQYRNGEGQPLRFRMLHNHRNNREVNTFGPDPSQKPTDEARKRFGSQMRTLVGGEDSPPDIPFGEGVNESNASALKGT